MTTTLTIAVPTFNRPLEVLKVINELISQLDKSALWNDIQILVCDNSREANKSLEKYRDLSNFKYVHNGENIGQARNINKLFTESDGEFVWILADDDVLLSNSILEVFNAIGRHTTEIKDIGFITFYTGDGRSPNLWIKTSSSNELISSVVFLESSWQHPIFISNNILNRKKTLKIITKYNLNSLVNDTYQNSVLSFLQIISTAKVLVIPKTLVIDSNRNKYYGVSQGFRVKIFDLMKLGTLVSQSCENKPFVKALSRSVISSSIVWGFIFTKTANHSNETIVYNENMKSKFLLFRYRFILSILNSMQFQIIWNTYYVILRCIKPKIALNVNSQLRSYMLQRDKKLVEQTYD